MDHSHHHLALLGTARRYARRRDEAEDIVQEVMIAAVRAGREDISQPANRRWMAGAIRKRAAFDARSATRRLRREAQWQAGRGADMATDADAPDTATAIVYGLPPALRVVAALALSGHTRREIAYLLGLSDAALRQRIAALKKALIKRGLAMPEDLPGLKLDLAYGQIRQGLMAHLRREKGAFATHDPDGHFFVVKSSRNT